MPRVRFQTDQQLRARPSESSGERASEPKSWFWPTNWPTSSGAIVILESETLNFRSPGVGAPPARYFTPRASASKARGTGRVVRESTPPQDPKAPVPEQRRPIPADRAE